MAIQSVPSTTPVNAERFTNTCLGVGPWGFNIGIGHGDLSAEEMRQVARMLIASGVATTKSVRARSDSSRDKLDDDGGLIAAELALNMAVALLDAADRSEDL